jgi:hypothetical protein
MTIKLFQSQTRNESHVPVNGTRVNSALVVTSPRFVNVEHSVQDPAAITQGQAPGWVHC